MNYKILQQLGRLKKDYYSISDLEKIFGQKRSVLYVTLNRLAKEKWIIRIRQGLYRIATITAASDDKIASQLYWPNYLSFESALSRYGIIDRIPYVQTFATTRKSKKIKLNDQAAEFRQIKKELFFGFSLKDGINIASPEKALLDQLYFVSRGRAVIDYDEINLKGLNKGKFLKYAALYPENTRDLAVKLAGQFGKVSISIDQ